jgi:CRP-like cAMP-binding protein
MYSVYPPPPMAGSLLRWQQVCNWAKENDRSQKYQKDAVLPCENGWIYFVQQGIVRLHGQQINKSLPSSSQSSLSQSSKMDSVESIDSASSLLFFVGIAQPFELMRTPQLKIQATAHTRNTVVMRIHARELSLVPGFEMDTLQAFRDQHQRQTLRLNNLTRGRKVDQLLGYLHLLAEEFGKEDRTGIHLPFALTHVQLAGAIGSTRVTITKMLGELRERGEISMSGDSKISLPRHQNLSKNLSSHLHLIE